MQVFSVEEELSQTLQSLLRFMKQIFVSHYVGWNFQGRLHPVKMELLPNRGFLLDELRPDSSVNCCFELILLQRLIVWLGADHVEETCHTVEGIPHD